MNSPTVQYVSECFIKPKYTSEQSKQPIYLSPADLSLVFVHYLQRGILFRKPPTFATDNKNHVDQLVKNLKESLSLTLVHFYPLAGRLATKRLGENPPSMAIYVDCTKGPGARFIQAWLDLAVDDIVSPIDVPEIVGSFFDHNGSINYDGCEKSLLSIQVTELNDGIFIGCSLNHMIGDGTSLWHFLNSWSEMFQYLGKVIEISRPPTYEKLFPEGYGPILALPFTGNEDEFMRGNKQKGSEKIFRERVFHFSAESIAKLKTRANAECNNSSTNNSISSLQALSAFVWRCITRIKNFPSDQRTCFAFVANNRTRLVPPLSQDCFGNFFHPLIVTTTCGELLDGSLGWAAELLHQSVINHTDQMIRESMNSWAKSPFFSRNSIEFSETCTIVLASSPRFNMYGTEFGLGKPLAIRSGRGSKFDGKVTANAGSEGGGSVDLEICLIPHVMAFLESDKEFMEAVSLSTSPIE
ncbi:hypothetical protein ACH5RR_033381 [Cinchona calisaya]|uniref:HXXXD-type acyl-transferase family protein n=1 Tax=Cinchona calisaya TaxID=153742 RepID=A0ABD2YPV0_9GENT